jgi:four helix bundle protein
MRDSTKIEAWRLTDDLTVAVYERTRCFPREEIYGLTSQVAPRCLFGSCAHRRRGIARQQERLPSLSLHCARLAVRDSVFIRLARRLNYLSLEEADTLRQQTKIAFGCLHGLIQAVEKEAGRLSKVVAGVTSLIVIGLMRWSGGQLFVVS